MARGARREKGNSVDGPRMGLGPVGRGTKNRGCDAKIRGAFEVAIFMTV